MLKDFITWNDFKPIHSSGLQFKPDKDDIPWVDYDDPELILKEIELRKKPIILTNTVTGEIRKFKTIYECMREIGNPATISALFRKYSEIKLDNFTIQVLTPKIKSLN